MHGDSGQRLHVHVSCWLPADAGALHACGIGSVAGAASSVRGDGISDDRADGGAQARADDAGVLDDVGCMFNIYNGSLIKKNLKNPPSPAAYPA